MESTTLLYFSAFVLVEDLIGFTLNTWILVANYKDWKRGLRLQPFDKIHIAMGLVNIFLQGMLTVVFFMTQNLSLFDKYIISVAYVFLLFLFFFAFWLNVCLSAYYLTSIVNFNHHFFSWLKNRFSVIMPKILLVAAVGSLLISLPCITKVTIKSSENSTVTCRQNCFIHVDYVYLVISACLGCYLPFTLSSLCLGYTLTYILRHVWRVRYNDCDSVRPNLEAHIRAARTMVRIFIICLILNIAQTLDFFSPNIAGDLNIVAWFFAISFPANQSTMIILATSKLRQIFQLMICFRHAQVKKSESSRQP